jgi:hypothetical protein
MKKIEMEKRQIRVANPQVTESLDKSCKTMQNKIARGGVQQPLKKNGARPAKPKEQGKKLIVY